MPPMNYVRKRSRIVVMFAVAGAFMCQYRTQEGVGE